LINKQDAKGGSGERKKRKEAKVSGGGHVTQKSKKKGRVVSACGNRQNNKALKKTRVNDAESQG